MSERQQQQLAPCCAHLRRVLQRIADGLYDDPREHAKGALAVHSQNARSEHGLGVGDRVAYLPDEVTGTITECRPDGQFEVEWSDGTMSVAPRAGLTDSNDSRPVTADEQMAEWTQRSEHGLPYCDCDAPRGVHSPRVEHHATCGGLEEKCCTHDGCEHAATYLKWCALHGPGVPEERFAPCGEPHPKYEMECRRPSGHDGVHSYVLGGEVREREGRLSAAEHAARADTPEDPETAWSADGLPPLAAFLACPLCHSGRLKRLAPDSRWALCVPCGNEWKADYVDHGAQPGGGSDAGD